MNKKHNVVSCLIIGVAFAISGIAYLVARPCCAFFLLLAMLMSGLLAGGISLTINRVEPLLYTWLALHVFFWTCIFECKCCGGIVFRMPNFKMPDLTQWEINAKDEMRMKYDKLIKENAQEESKYIIK